jgi:hypothetical protein
MSATKKTRANASRSQRRQAAAKRRRELAGPRRTGSAGAGTAGPSRRRGPVVAIAVLGAGAIAAGTVAFAGTSGDDTPGVALRGPLVAAQAPEQRVTAPPATYRVTYRVESMSGSQVLEEQLVVRRPFDLRFRFGDEGALDTPLLDRIETEQYTTTVETGATSAQRADGALPVLGNRFDVTIPDLVERGVYVRRERRQVLGEECTAYRTGAVVESFVVSRPAAGLYADLCISDDGIVLEEVSVTNGEADLRVIATAVERGPAIGDADFPVATDPGALEAGGVESRDLSRTDAPVTPYWRPAGVPAGWTHRARRQIDVAARDVAAGPSGPATSFVDVYTRDADVIVVRQGLTGDAPDTISTAQAVDIDLGALGRGQLVLGAATATAIVADTNGRFVHVQGTVRVDELRSFASSLTT